MGITLWQYYLNRAAQITDRACDAEKSLPDWEAKRPTVYRQFMESMALDPLPPRCDLKVTDYGQFRGRGYRAEKVAYQILPDCWSTGTLYFPDPLPEARCPGVLYLCGHNKIGVHGYQTHGIMWARRGYVCFVFDTIEQHDNLGTHHGTYYRDRYDWFSLGYSGAGGELWNGMRALDVLEKTPGVDPRRLGATGISGGGAQSFYLAVADPRVKALATACGVTLAKHTLADRHVQTHCDCIYYHNLYQRDSSEYAGLIAPRPALFCYTSEDALFSQAEYRLLVEKARKIYRLHGCEDACALSETPGPHGYHPDSVRRINDWFDRHVAGAPHPAEKVAELENPESRVTVFNGAPPPSNKVHLLPELLSPRGSFPLPATPEEWPAIQAAAREVLREKVFHALDAAPEPLEIEAVGNWFEGGVGARYQPYRGRIAGVDIWLAVHTRGRDSGKVLLAVAGPDETARDLFARLHAFAEEHTIVTLELRGSGLSGAHPNMEWDLLRAGAITGMMPTQLTIQDLQLVMPFLHALPAIQGRQLCLYGKADAGVACLYHAVFDTAVSGVIAEDPPVSHRQGAHLLGILRYGDIDHAAGLVAPRSVALVNQPLSRNMWAQRAFARLGCSDRLYAGGSLRVAIERAFGAEYSEHST